MDFIESSKNDCWYKKVCSQDLCGEDAFCPRFYRMDYLVSHSLLQGKQRYSIPLYPDNIDINAFKRLKEIQQNINTFVSDGKNLLIYSETCGNGKTEWAKKLMLSWLNSVWHSTDFVCRALFLSMPRLVQSMKENISKENEYFQYVNANVNTADLIVWDEINYKEWTPYEQEFMLNIISNRVAIGKSNIYTTNYNLSEIERRLGARLNSRIVGCSELIELKGKDKRGIKGNE